MNAFSLEAIKFINIENWPHNVPCPRIYGHIWIFHRVFVPEFRIESHWCHFCGHAQKKWPNARVSDEKYQKVHANQTKIGFRLMDGGLCSVWTLNSPSSPSGQKANSGQ